MSVEIDTLEVEIQASSAQASTNIGNLVSSLERLKTTAKGGAGLRTVSNQLNALNTALKGLNDNSQKISSLVSALNSLGSIQKATGLSSTVNALKKLDSITEQLSSTDMDAFARQIQRVTNAISPLATEMQKVSNGFAAFPIRIQKAIAASGQAQKSFGSLVGGIKGSLAKLTILGYSVNQAADIISDWVKESNDYVENLNLFTVAMGDAADEAYEYAYAVNDALGIDPSEWMRNQGIFKQIASGFGVVEEKANLMSKNLTQLGYDISSFYNISIEEAMQKLESGISGEIEPLRRLGYAIDEASLKQVALNHGITQSITTMTQAQKSQLRYIAIMEQSGNAMGDLARTVQTPANAMRILNQQLTQLTRALGNLFIPILQKIIPYIQVFVELLTEAVQRLADFVGFTLPTIDYSNMEDGMSSMGETTDETTEKVNDLKKSLLGIDELNILSPTKETNGVQGSSSDLGLQLPEYDFMAGLTGTSDELKTQVENSLNSIMAILAGAKLAIGAILAFTGVNIPLGIGLMALGAIELATVAILNWKSMDEMLRSVLLGIFGTISPMLLVLGAILTFSGADIPLGIGMMIIGATGLATAVSLSWGSINDELKSALGLIMVTIGLVPLAIGTILALTGANIPLGIALMAIGAATMASGYAIAWNAMSEPIRAALTLISSIVGGAFLALGGVLAFSGVNIPLGIGLMAIGAAMIATAVAMNWGSLTENIKSVLTILTGVIGGAFLVLGFFLAASGANIPLGVGLVAIGAASLATAIGLNWNLLPENIKTVIATIAAVLSLASLVLGAILAFSGINIGLGLALIALGIATGVAANISWDSIPESIQNVIATITAILSGALLVIGAVLTFTGFNIPLGIGLMVAGLVGMVALSAMGGESIITTVKTVLSTIMAIAGTSLVALGIILIATGAGIPLGISLIIAGAASLIGSAFTGGSSSVSGRSYSSSLNSITSTTRSFVNANARLFDSYSNSVSSLNNLNVKGPDIQTFASGGFPEHGQMFIANENGPELIGQIGTRTAVVNNDQIVSGIAEANNGVINAVMAIGQAIVKAINDQETSVQLDGKVVSRALYSYNQQVSREKGSRLVTGGVAR
nr:MAG TPA: minor tail protein [Caudoviricetes sp.]